MNPLSSAGGFFAMQTYGNEAAATTAPAAMESPGCEAVPPECEAAACSVRGVAAGDGSGSLSESSHSSPDGVTHPLYILFIQVSPCDSLVFWRPAIVGGV